MDIQRGTRDKLEKYANLNEDIEILMDVFGGSVYDYSCFAVDRADKLSDDRYMVFYNQKQSPKREIVYTPNGTGAKFTIKLNQLPAFINKLVFTVSIDGSGTMGNISYHSAIIQQNASKLLEMRLNGSDFNSEKAIISIEIYKKDVWRFAAVASGFNGGLSDLLRAYGGEEITNHSDSSIQNAQPQNLPKKVELKKGQKVNLKKNSSGTLGEVLINLNWNQPAQKSGFFGLRSQAIDLDLGCLFELKNGRKGCVQALGNTFGSLTSPPYIALDNDDRSGASINGENLRINGSMLSEIKQILVYTFIYKGAVNWSEAKGIVTVKCPGSQELIVRMDEYGSSLPMCAIALLENCNNETFSVEKIVRFFQGHRFMDRAFNWGMQWVPGRK